MQGIKSSLRRSGDVDSVDHNVRFNEWDSGHRQRSGDKNSRTESVAAWMQKNKQSANVPDRPVRTPAAATDNRSSSRAQPRMEAIPEHAPHKHAQSPTRPTLSPAVEYYRPGAAWTEMIRVFPEHARDQKDRADRDQRSQIPSTDAPPGPAIPTPSTPQTTEQPRQRRPSLWKDRRSATQPGPKTAPARTDTTSRPPPAPEQPPTAPSVAAIRTKTSASVPPSINPHAMPSVYASRTTVTRTRVFAVVPSFKPARATLAFDTATFEEIHKHVSGHRSAVNIVRGDLIQICPGTYVSCINCPAYRTAPLADLMLCPERTCEFYGPSVSRWTADNKLCNTDKAIDAARYECLRCEYGRARLGGGFYDSYLGYCFNCRGVTELGIRLPGEPRFCCGNKRCRKDAGAEFQYDYYCDSCQQRLNTTGVTTISRTREPLV